jgi:hypothetical protein
MVAMLETREATTLYIGEIDPAALKLMLLDSQRIAEPFAPSEAAKLLPGKASIYEDEPTWEDAAWQ